MSRDHQRALIYESELEIMAGNAACFGEKETGGELYGCFDRMGNPIVQFVTGPGPGAKHLEHHFAQDIDWFRATCDRLASRLSLEYLGRYHSHHTIGLVEPSSGDVRSLCELARRNRIRRPLEVIVTHSEDEDAANHSRIRRSRGSQPLQDAIDVLVQRVRDLTNLGTESLRASLAVANVQIYPYMYTNTARGVYESCSVSVLPGESPIRYAARQWRGDRVLERLLRVPRYPLAQIRIEGNNEASSESVPRELLEEFEELTELVKEGSEVFFSDGQIVFSLPLNSQSTALLIYESRAPHRVTVSVQTPSGNFETVAANRGLDGSRSRMIELYAEARRAAPPTPEPNDYNEAQTRVNREPEGDEVCGRQLNKND